MIGHKGRLEPQCTVRRFNLSIIAGVEFIPENGGGAGVRLRKGKSSTDHPKPVGPATDAVKDMDTAIDEHRSRRKR